MKDLTVSICVYRKVNLITGKVMYIIYNYIHMRGRYDYTVLLRE